MSKGNAYHACCSTHPCYEYGRGYVCECGNISAIKELHDTHVITCHDKEFAERNLDWRTYEKNYEPEKWKKEIEFRKECNKIKAALRKSGFKDLRFLGWCNKENRCIVLERDLIARTVKIIEVVKSERTEITIDKI